MAFVDYKEQAWGIARQGDLNKGIVDLAVKYVSWKFRRTISIRQIEQRVHILKQDYSEEYYDFLRQGSSVLNLEEEERGKIAEEVMLLNLLEDEQYQEKSDKKLRGRTHNPPKKSLDFLNDGLDNGTTSSQPHTKPRCTKSGAQENASTSATRGSSADMEGNDAKIQAPGRVSVASKDLSEDLDMFQDAPTHPSLSPQSRSLNVTLPIVTKETTTDISAHRITESALSLLKHVIDRTEDLEVKSALGEVTESVQDEIFLLRGQIDRLKDALKDEKEKHDALNVEHQTLVNSTNLGNAANLVQQVANLKNQLRDQGKDLEREINDSLVFDLKTWNRTFKHNEVRCWANDFKELAYSPSFSHGSSSKSLSFLTLQHTVPKAVMQRLLDTSNTSSQLRWMQTWSISAIDPSMVAQALLAATACEYIFDQSLGGLLEKESTILKYYRRLIQEKHNSNAVRVIDFLAHELWVEEELLAAEVVRQKAEILARDFCQWIMPILGGQQSSGSRKQKRIDVTMRRAQQIFESAWELKARMLLSPRLYEVKMFPPGSRYNKGVMTPEDGSKATPDMDICLCLHPAIFSWKATNDEKKMFDYCGFVTKHSHRQRPIEERGFVSAALVVCKQKAPITVSDSEDDRPD